MNINATDELIRVLDEIDAKIKRLENSPNRAFVLIEYDTLSSFHWFNLCFKQFWDDFDRHSASQLLQYQNIVETFSELSNRYVKLLREQIGYLGGVIDFNGKCVKNLPPVIFSEDNSKDVIGYYEECCKYEKDEEGKPLYTIRVDREMHSEVIDGKNVPIDFYLFESDTLNDAHYKSLLGMHNCLNNIYLLMCTVCSYPERLIYGFQLDQEDIISALENGLRQYAMEVGKKVERDLKKIAQELKPSRNTPLTPDVWGQVMQREDEMYEQAINTQVGEMDDKFLENISATKILLIDNYSLLEKVKTTCLDGEFFDIELSIGTHNLLSSLNADNLDLFYELVLRRNIIQREMFPNELGDKYEEWLNNSEEESEEIDEEQEVICGEYEVPTELKTEEAEELWKQLRDAGFIIADGYDLAEGISNNQAAYIADSMSGKLKIKNKWKEFEFWGIPNMAQLAGTWKETGKLPPRANEIDEIME